MTTREKLEAGFTILAILALWPVILGWDNPAYQVVLGVILVVFIALVAQKFRRIRAIYNATRVEAKKRKPTAGNRDEPFG
ncbi:MAG: hypothetical protein F4Z29_03165 [Gemmatimonadetes bacterium]|nr:hypothetical protein [Gemmatimonadota bacterium]